MKSIALAAIFLLVAFEASALVRYMVEDMTCVDIQGAIERDGAVILYRPKTSSGVPLYDRYVADATFCSSTEAASRESVPAADTENCPVKKCVDASRYGD